jgi:hypothetical protein
MKHLYHEQSIKETYIVVRIVDEMVATQMNRSTLNMEL